MAEGINGVELPEELSGLSHDLQEEYGNKLEFIGAKHNLPEELIQDLKEVASIEKFSQNYFISSDFCKKLNGLLNFLQKL